MVKDYFTPIEFKEEEEVVTPVETDELPFYKEPLDVIERSQTRISLSNKGAMPSYRSLEAFEGPSRQEKSKDLLRAR